jgi:hypothetical protein
MESKQQSRRGVSSQIKLTEVRERGQHASEQSDSSLGEVSAVRAKCQQSQRADRRHEGDSSQQSVKEMLQPSGEVLLASES